MEAELEKSIFLSAKLIRHHASLMTKESEVDTAIEVVSKILQERKEEIAKEKKEDATRKAALEKAVKELQSKGVSKDMIASFLGFAKTESVNDKAKKRFVKDGVSWSGRGKAPAAFSGIGREELFQYEVKEETGETDQK